MYDRFKDGVEAKIKEKGGLAAKLFVAGLEKKIAVLQVRIRRCSAKRSLGDSAADSVRPLPELGS